MSKSKIDIALSDYAVVSPTSKTCQEVTSTILNRGNALHIEKQHGSPEKVSTTVTTQSIGQGPAITVSQPTSKSNVKIGKFAYQLGLPPKPGTPSISTATTEGNQPPGLIPIQISLMNPMTQLGQLPNLYKQSLQSKVKFQSILPWDNTKNLYSSNPVTNANQPPQQQQQSYIVLQKLGSINNKINTASGLSFAQKYVGIHPSSSIINSNCVLVPPSTGFKTSGSITKENPQIVIQSQSVMPLKHQQLVLHPVTQHTAQHIKATPATTTTPPHNMVNVATIARNQKLGDHHQHIVSKGGFVAQQTQLAVSTVTQPMCGLHNILRQLSSTVKKQPLTTIVAGDQQQLQQYPFGTSSPSIVQLLTNPLQQQNHLPKTQQQQSTTKHQQLTQYQLPSTQLKVPSFICPKSLNERLLLPKKDGHGTINVIKLQSFNKPPIQILPKEQQNDNNVDLTTELPTQNTTDWANIFGLENVDENVPELSAMKSCPKVSSFFPDTKDRSFLTILGLEFCVDELHGEYFNISKSLSRHKGLLTKRIPISKQVLKRRNSGTAINSNVDKKISDVADSGPNKRLKKSVISERSTPTATSITEKQETESLFSDKDNNGVGGVDVLNTKRLKRSEIVPLLGTSSTTIQQSVPDSTILFGDDGNGSTGRSGAQRESLKDPNRSDSEDEDDKIRYEVLANGSVVDNNVKKTMLLQYTRKSSSSASSSSSTKEDNSNSLIIDLSTEGKMLLLFYIRYFYKNHNLPNLNNFYKSC